MGLYDNQYDDFWDRVTRGAPPATQTPPTKKPGGFLETYGPGLFDLGVGLYNRHAANKEAASRLAAAQGPLYQQAMGGAGGMLAAGLKDPTALATERFNAKEALLKPLQDKQQADLMRSLHAKGMLGISNYNPSTVLPSGQEISIAPTGQAMNPHMAAFFAAQNADRARRAQSALDEGLAYQTGMLGNARNLQGLASNTQQTGLVGQMTQPSRAAQNATLLKGLGGMIFNNPDTLRKVWDFGSGLFGSAADWIGGLFS